MAPVRGGSAAALAASTLAAASLLAGCGTTVDVAALKTQLGAVADALDTCVNKTNDARRCTTTDVLGSLPTGTELGDGDGQIRVEAPRALAYRLVGHAGDDVEFVIAAQPVGARRRICTPAGSGPCGKDGVW